MVGEQRRTERRPLARGSRPGPRAISAATKAGGYSDAAGVERMEKKEDIWDDIDDEDGST